MTNVKRRTGGPHGAPQGPPPEKLCRAHAPYLVPAVDALVPRWRRRRLGAREADRALRRRARAAVLVGTDPAHWDGVDARARSWAHVWERVHDAWAVRDRVLRVRDTRDRLAYVRTLARRVSHHGLAAPAAFPALVSLPTAAELARLVAAQRGNNGGSSSSSSSSNGDGSDDGENDDDDGNGSADDEYDVGSACTTTDIDDVHSCTPGIITGETPGGFTTGDNTPMC